MMRQWIKEKIYGEAVEESEPLDVYENMSVSYRVARKNSRLIYQLVFFNHLTEYKERTIVQVDRHVVQELRDTCREFVEIMQQDGNQDAHSKY